MWNLALLASPTEQLDAARYFENADHKQFDKAVILYEKETINYYYALMVFSGVDFLEFHCGHVIVNIYKLL